jgi:hypothetical protein
MRADRKSNPFRAAFQSKSQSKSGGPTTRFRNVGGRNSTHNGFELAELKALRDGGAFYGVLAASANDLKLARAG